MEEEEEEEEEEEDDDCFFDVRSSISSASCFVPSSQVTQHRSRNL